MISNDERISLHHVGGRSGGRGFPLLMKFEKDMINVIYDADSDCIEQVQEKSQNLESELHVLAYCLADSCKSTSFNLNYDPFTSSLYDFNPDYKSAYYFNVNHDYILSECFRTMEKRDIEAVSIDYIFQSTDISIPPPDFLSIDTQGSEYDILLGAKETLKSNVVAVVMEAELHPIYKGQKVFGDLVKLMSDQGFYFVRFLDISSCPLFRAPIGLRGEGFQLWSDALFFRRIDNFGSSKDELRRYLMLRKLAFISIAFNQFEYGLECLRQSNNSINSHHSTMRKEEPVYLRFLREFEQQVKKIPAAYLPTFTSSITSFAQSKSRFESVASKTRLEAKTGKINKIIQSLKRAKAICSAPYQKFKKKTYPKVSIPIKRIFTGYNDVETFLISYGLKTQANVLKENRLIQSRFIKS